MVCEEIAGIQTAALGRRLRHLGYPPVVIGVSGGLDSTLALLIAHMTFIQMGLPTDRIIAMTLPGMGTSDHTRSNAEALMRGLGVTSETHSIVAMAEAELRTLGHTTHDVTFENVQARARTALLFNRANQVKGLVLGTGDLSELALGWMTYCGDSESHYHINAGIPKTLIRVLVEWLGRQPMFEAEPIDRVDYPHTHQPGASATWFRRRDRTADRRLHRPLHSPRLLPVLGNSQTDASPLCAVPCETRVSGLRFLHHPQVAKGILQPLRQPAV